MVDSNAERAQLLLITALLIATFIMSAVVLLNLLHESPTFDTQQDSLSMSDTERVSAQLEGDLHQYFYAHTSDELVGYAAGDFDEEIDELGSRYTNLTGQSASGHLNVGYNHGESEDGDIVYWNDSRGTVDDQIVYENISHITRLSFEASEYDDLDVRFDIGNGSTILEISENEVYWENKSFSEDVNWYEFVEIEITHHTGEIRTDRNYSADVEIDTEGEFNVSASVNELEQGDNARFYISSPDALTSSDFYEREGVIINPAFDITYTNPDIRYSSTIQLFEERDQ